MLFFLPLISGPFSVTAELVATQSKPLNLFWILCKPWYTSKTTSRVFFVTEWDEIALKESGFMDFMNQYPLFFKLKTRLNYETDFMSNLVQCMWVVDFHLHRFYCWNENMSPSFVSACTPPCLCWLPNKPLICVAGHAAGVIDN